MKMIRYIPLFLIFLFSCSEDLPDDVNNNPLDPNTAVENNFSTPALVFYPHEISPLPGSDFTVEVFAMQVDSNAGAYMQIQYDQSKMHVVDFAQGDFYSDAPEMLFYFEDDSASGVIDIYTGYLGIDSAYVSGTGQLATITFNARVDWESIISFTENCRLAGPQNEDIEILGFGECAVHAQ